MSAASGIFLEVDGQPVDLNKVSWYEKPPCGCPACGVTIAYSDYGNGPARIIATAQQAIEQFWETKRERDKYERMGFTVFADLTSRVKDLLAVDCPHEPRFGVPKRPEVEGYKWAAVRAMGSRSPLMHLVSDLALDDATERRYGSDNGKPLCGGKSAFWWSTEWHALDGKVECARCMKRAAS